MVEVLVSGWLIGLAIALPVGPVITEIMRRGLRDGFLAGWLVGVGAAVSHVILVALTLLGVVALLDRPIWHTFLGGAGILVLGYLGVGALWASGDPPTAEDAARTGRSFLVGFGIGISNPITLLWFVTVGGALIAAHGGGGSGLLAVTFGMAFICGVLCWDTVVAYLAGCGRYWMGPRTLRMINLVAGSVFLGFAIRLGWKLAQTLR